MNDPWADHDRMMARELEKNEHYSSVFFSMTRNERRSAQGKLRIAEERIKDLERQLAKKESGHE